MSISSSPIDISKRLRHCPRSTPTFRGRKVQLEKANKYFGNDKEAQHLFVMHGPGGAGKTQTALKSAEQMIGR